MFIPKGDKEKVYEVTDDCSNNIYNWETGDALEHIATLRGSPKEIAKNLMAFEEVKESLGSCTIFIPFMPIPFQSNVLNCLSE